jgi:RNA polymerase II subunit A-like phosphatase
MDRSDIAIWIKSFGAEVATNVNRRTTHVIASPDRKTTKVKNAARYPHIKIVNAEWMIQCCTRWERVDETPYLIEVDPAERGGSPLPEDDSMDGEDEDVPEAPLINFDSAAWASVDDELAEFLDGTDSEDEKSDSDESIRSDSKKRKRSTNSTDVSDAEESDSSVTSSKLQRRKKRTMQRVTSLTNVELAGKSSGLPSPDTTGPEEDEEKANGVAEDYDDGLEAQLIAGFEDSDDE